MTNPRPGILLFSLFENFSPAPVSRGRGLRQCAPSRLGAARALLPAHLGPPSNWDSHHAPGHAGWLTLNKTADDECGFMAHQGCMGPSKAPYVLEPVVARAHDRRADAHQPLSRHGHDHRIVGLLFLLLLFAAQSGSKIKYEVCSCIHLNV